MIIGTESIFNQYNQIKGITAKTNKTQDFGDILKSTFKETAHTIRENEHLVHEKALGEVDLTKLITHTSQLEVSLNLITACRDKVVSMLTEMQKMNI